jgi:hypothetical protein
MQDPDRSRPICCALVMGSYWWARAVLHPRKRQAQLPVTPAFARLSSQTNRRPFTVSDPSLCSL